jgi:hypothetical protein
MHQHTIQPGGRRPGLGTILGRKIAEDIVLSPRKKPQGLRSSDLVDPSLGAHIGADWAMGGSMGQARAGRAEAMSSAMGKEAPFVVRRPRVHAAGFVLGGALAGSVVGSLAAALEGKASGRDSNETAGNIYMAGSLLGAAGTLGGVTYSVLKRRRDVNRISRDFDEHQGDIVPTARKGNLFGFSPSHARGREEAFRAMLGGSRKMRGSTTDNVLAVLQGVSRVGGPVAPAAVQVATMPILPFLVNDSNENMAEIARADGAYGFRPRQEKLAAFVPDRSSEGVFRRESRTAALLTKKLARYRFAD